MLEILLFIYFLGIVVILYSLTFHLDDLNIKEYLMFSVLAIFWPIAIVLALCLTPFDEEYY